MTTPSPALASLLASVDNGDYYSAHQKARTTATRLLTSRRAGVTPAPDKVDEAERVLWDVGRKLLEKGQVGSGADLVGYLVEVWKKNEKKLGDSERAQVLQILALMGNSGTWRKTFADSVFAWSASTGSGASGDAAVHGYLGNALFKEKDFHSASLHLLLCPTADAARTLADLMFEWSKLDPEGVAGCGRYAARGCLSYLESEAILPARTFLSHFLSLVLTAHPDLLVVHFPFPAADSALAKSLSSTAAGVDELIVTKLPSLNFLQLAIRTCQAGAGETVEKVKQSDGSMKEVKGKGRTAWQSLVQRYEREVPWLKGADAKESTQELGTIFFGIRPPRPPGNAMMDMLGSMFGGGGGPAIGAR